jgi:rRNA maturation protein Nop10
MRFNNPREVEGMSQICYKCGRYADNEVFCEKCGEHTSPAPLCNWCHAELKFTWSNFCPNCGKQRGSSPVQEKPRKIENQAPEEQKGVKVKYWIIDIAIGLINLTAGVSFAIEDIGWWRLVSVVFFMIGIYKAIIKSLLHFRSLRARKKASPGL